MRDQPLVSPWASPGDRRAKQEAKREAVLRTAAQLFARNGYHSTSLDQVARHLGVSKPTLYRYVKNKEEILYECCRIGLSTLDSAIEGIGRREAPAIDKLIAAFRKDAEVTLTDYGKCAALVGMDPLPPERFRELRRIQQNINEQLRALADEAMAEGSIATCDPAIPLSMMAGTFAWVARWFRPDGPLSAEAITDEFVRLLMDGLTVRDPGDGDRHSR